VGGAVLHQSIQLLAPFGRAVVAGCWKTGRSSAG
jgi:hypothetical protein